MKNKALPYIIFGVPILIGGFFLYKSFAQPRRRDLQIPEEPKDKDTPSGDGGGGFTPKTTLPFKKGASGDYVKSIQSKLGISADGLFGSQTDASVRAFQKANGLVVDGIVGKNTWKAMFGADFPSLGVSSGTFTSPKKSTSTLNKYATTKFPTDPTYWD